MTFPIARFTVLSTSYLKYSFLSAYVSFKTVFLLVYSVLEIISGMHSMHNEVSSATSILQKKEANRRLLKGHWEGVFAINSTFI